jgi:hypothetical protein
MQEWLPATIDTLRFQTTGSLNAYLNIFTLQDIFDNELGHGILAVKEVLIGSAFHIAAVC